MKKTPLSPSSAFGPQRRYKLREGAANQFLKLNVLDIGVAVAIHRLTGGILRIPLKAKPHAIALSGAMSTGEQGCFGGKSLQFRLQFSGRARDLLRVTTDEGGLRTLRRGSNFR